MNQFLKLARYDALSKKMRIQLKDYFSKNVIEVDIPSVSGEEASLDPIGYFCQVKGGIISLLCLDRSLFIFIEKKLIPIGEDVLIVFQKKENSRLTVTGSSGILIDVKEEFSEPVGTPFYSEDDEDADFFLWINNVLNSKSRKRDVTSQWSLSNEG